VGAPILALLLTFSLPHPQIDKGYKELVT